MLKKFLAVTSILAVAAVASAQFSASWEPYYEGVLPGAGDYVYSFDLKVSVPEGDAWTVAGGPVVGDPWITLTSPDGGVFYQEMSGLSGNPPNPLLFPVYPDLEYDSFYTTHLGYPNTADVGVSPGFAVGPINNDYDLIADWYWTPDGNDYLGDFTIARFTVQAPAGISGADNYADINMLVGSRETVPVPYTARVPIPEPASLALLALGGLALIRRR